jgi:hypothetical protein
VEVLQHEDRLVPCQPVDQRASQFVEAGTDSMPLPTPFPPEQKAGQTSVVGFLSTEILSPTEVSYLDRPDIGEEDADEPSSFGAHPDSVQGGLVGVERYEGPGGVGFRGGAGVYEAHPVKSEVDLSDPMCRISEDPSEVVGDRNRHRRPLATSEGEAQLSGLAVEVEGPCGDTDEGGTNVRSATGNPLPEPGSVTAGEGARNIGGGAANRSGDSRFQGLGPGESGESSTGRQSIGEGVAQALVDQEAEVVHEESERRRSRRFRREMNDDGATGVHESEDGGLGSNFSTPVEDER